MSDRRKSLDVIKSFTGEYLWRFKASNGQIVSHGETYKTKASAIKGALMGSPVEEIIENTEDGDVIWYYEDQTLYQGRYNYIDWNDEVQKMDPVNTPTGTVSLEAVLENDNALTLMAAGIELVADHWIVNNHVLHPKHPDHDKCAIPFCQMYMKVDPEATMAIETGQV